MKRDKSGRFVANKAIKHPFVYVTLGIIATNELVNLILNVWYSIFPAYQ